MEGATSASGQASVVRGDGVLAAPDDGHMEARSNGGRQE